MFKRIKWSFEDRMSKWEVFDPVSGCAIMFVPFKWMAVWMCKRSPMFLDYERTILG